MPTMRSSPSTMSRRPASSVRKPVSWSCLRNADSGRSWCWRYSPLRVRSFSRSSSVSRSDSRMTRRLMARPLIMMVSPLWAPRAAPIVACSAGAESPASETGRRGRGEREPASRARTRAIPGAASESRSGRDALDDLFGFPQGGPGVALGHQEGQGDEERRIEGTQGTEPQLDGSGGAVSCPHGQRTARRHLPDGPAGKEEVERLGAACEAGREEVVAPRFRRVQPERAGSGEEGAGEGPLLRQRVVEQADEDQARGRLAGGQCAEDGRRAGGRVAGRQAFRRQAERFQAEARAE